MRRSYIADFAGEAESNGAGAAADVQQGHVPVEPRHLGHSLHQGLGPRRVDAEVGPRGDEEIQTQHLLHDVVRPEQVVKLPHACQSLLRKLQRCDLQCYNEVGYLKLKHTTYVTLPSIPVLEKASQSPLDILYLVRREVLRNKVDNNHRLFLQRNPAIH